VKEGDINKSGEREDVLPAGESQHRSMLSSASKSTPPPHINITMIEGKMCFDYTSDKEFGKIYDMLKEERALVNGNVYVEGLVYVLKKERREVMEACHSGEGHVRGNKLAIRVAKSFHWDKLTKDCKRFAETYQEC
jgi:hypothetical protein